MSKPPQKRPEPKKRPVLALMGGGIVALIVIAAGARYFFAVNQSAPVAIEATSKAPHIVELRIAHRAATGPEVSEGPAVRVTEGEEVEIRWHSDEDATLQFHGYDIMTAIVAGGEAVTRFKAAATGRFPIETHSIGGDQNLHVVLIFMEVYPR
jgi:hypothetical protein